MKHANGQGGMRRRRMKWGSLMRRVNWTTKDKRKHGEWQDTEVREAIYAWLDETAIIKATEARATVVVEFSFPVDVVTLDGNARSVLENKNDEIQDILDDAVADAFSRIEEKIGRIAGEWSGISVRII